MQVKARKSNKYKATPLIMAQKYFLVLGIFLGCSYLMGCSDRLSVSEGKLPPSQRDASLKTWNPSSAIQHIEEWYPHDWRILLVQGLTDSSQEQRIAYLQKAESLNRHESLIPYFLCLAYLELGDTINNGVLSAQEMDSLPKIQYALAEQALEKALQIDSQNAVLKVLQAYIFLKQDKAELARALFQSEPNTTLNKSDKNFSGTFYYARIEEILVGLFSYSQNLNPYNVNELIEVYRKIPMPPFENMVNILYQVFLDPLPEHPYDIRVRGKAAAMNLFQLGYNLRIGYNSHVGLFPSNYEQRSLGFMFQLKASEFLTLFYRTFEDTLASQKNYGILINVQKEYGHFMESSPWQDSSAMQYMQDWENLIRDSSELTLGQASEKAKAWGFWKRTIQQSYPRRDDRP